MTALLSEERLADRARDLGLSGHNGMRLVYVTLEAAPKPGFAWLDLEFHNTTGLAPLPPLAAFRVEGGVRLRAGSLPGQVQVTEIHANPDGRPEALRLKVAPVGDHSSYVLSTSAVGLVAPADALPRAMDPLLNRLPFKFRPGCFNLDCAPTWVAAAPPAPAPVIDYLARDYDSFRHVLMSAMAERVPGWAATSEADLDQVLIDLIAAQADELADHHDRVVAERAITTARKRVSFARHGRLVDYHLHQGNQASTWVAVQVAGAAVDLPLLGSDAGGNLDEWAVWNGSDWRDPEAVVFALPHDGPRWRRRAFALLNTLQLYTWGDTVTALAAGSTSADLRLAGSNSEADAVMLEDLLNQASGLQSTADADIDTGVDQLLIEETLNPATGAANGRNVQRRQLLRLRPVGERAQRLQDPVTGDWFVRVAWIDADALTQTFCFVCDCGGVLVRDLTLFHGNLVPVTQGRPRETRFLPPNPLPLPAADDGRLRALSHGHWLRRQRQDGPQQTADATLCVLPASAGVLAWRATPADGVTPPRSSLTVQVSGFSSAWSEHSDLVDSRDDAEHFIVEVHENQTAQLRFGNGINGRALPADATVTAAWRSGQGVAGHVGADTLTSASTDVLRVWNPFDVSNGREPEPVTELQRRAPEAYRRHQLRAVTLADYAARAEAVPGVAHARARYAWSGSWRVVRVAIDPVGGGALQPALHQRIASTLDAVRLIGDDVELRAAEPVPLDIRVGLCARSGYWTEDLRVELEMAFSDADLPGGGRGLFHPDAWTFGQPLYASQVIGRALAVTGVERVTKLSMRRFNPGSGGGLTVVEVDLDKLPESTAQRLDIGDFEILVVANDPDHLERGRIGFDIQGGRR
jgi:hypothetical protein